MGAALEVIKLIFRLMFPPMEPFETRLFYSWRNLLAATVLLLGGVVVTTNLAAFGAIVIFGFTGFAHADALTDINRQLKEQRQQIVASNNQTMAIVIGGQAFELSTRLCAAQRSGNGDAEQSYRQQLQGTLETYERVSGRQYRLQGCP